MPLTDYDPSNNMYSEQDKIKTWTPRKTMKRDAEKLSDYEEDSFDVVPATPKKDHAAMMAAKMAAVAIERTLAKKKRFIKKDDTVGSNLSWMQEQAKKWEFPSEEDSVMLPSRIFKTWADAPLPIYMCYDCTKHNSTQPAVDVGGGRFQLPMALCNICRHHLMLQTSKKFWNFDLPLFKRKNQH
ncbi:unnamed protein product [Caenorhabditis sp. 36 PRJEB53466]|nr:unnamed protein product [Caenorhabditis sp. 36 PRJEB53466]